MATPNRVYETPQRPPQAPSRTTFMSNAAEQELTNEINSIDNNGGHWPPAATFGTNGQCTDDDDDDDEVLGQYEIGDSSEEYDDEEEMIEEEEEGGRERYGAPPRQPMTQLQPYANNPSNYDVSPLKVYISGPDGKVLQQNIQCQIAPLGTDPASMIKPIQPLTVRIQAPADLFTGDPSQPRTISISPSQLYGGGQSNQERKV